MNYKDVFERKKQIDGGYMFRWMRTTCRNTDRFVGFIGDRNNIFYVKRDDGDDIGYCPVFVY